MFGSLSVNIGLLGSSLQNLTLSQNTFSGSLPLSFYSFSNLQRLEINANHFTGSLSDYLGLNMANTLEVLNIENNYFEGTLPSTLSALSHLQRFLIGKNMFLFSPYPSFSNETTPALQVIEASGAGLSGGPLPDGYYTLSKLQVLSLAYTQVTGTLPAKIGDCWPELRVFNFYETRLQGSLPESFGKLTNLEAIVIELTAMTNTLPPSITQLQKLTVLSLPDNMFSGSLPFDNLYEAFPLLRECFLNANRFTGPLPGYFDPNTTFKHSSNNLIHIQPLILQNETLLEKFSLSGNQFTGSLTSARYAGFNQHLIEFNIAVNQLTSSLPNDLLENHFSGVQYFYLNNNFFTSSIPLTLFNNLSSVRNIDLTGNVFTGTLPSSIIYQDMNLQSLQIDSNYLTGSIPNAVCGLLALGNLQLSINALTGTIPVCLFHLPKLFSIIFFENQLSSTLPTFSQLMEPITGNISKLAPLSTVVLSENRLTGPVPSYFTNFTALYLLNLAINFFTGTFPSTLLLLPNAQYIDISENRLTGQIPFEISLQGPSADKASLELQLYLQNNAFEGDLSTLFESISKSITLLDLSVNQFTGKLVIPMHGSDESDDDSHGTGLLLNSLDLATNYMTGKRMPHSY
jgi:hypothetical protein